ncbi:aldehyde dehydrogenase family protein [Deinococcus sp. Arct2-2]|uniref:aldehyde dehydrogenase family protein n=1 Tax=Deinococcus sp. Arct2-2 TaxID=2568653 RepID=UPI0010A3F55F|nr:aldehyde dehydrogenase family protein [Deinococcus sp. Arct2-2]THF71244.1 aldehyde dehydrogenase family protein [Deinococcus sp. Arct2-2]
MTTAPRPQSEPASPPLSGANSPELHALFALQQAHRPRAAGASVAERQALLRRLHDALKAGRVALADALAADLGKSRAESEITEIHPVLEELQHAIRALPRWAAPRRVATTAMLGTAHSEIRPQARGITLILSPWNYPVNLALAPLVASLAAGNTVILKPSEKAPATARALQRLLEQTFQPQLVAVVLGGPDVAQTLTTLPFDHIFFTGSGAVGRQVLRAAAENLTSVTLELGGKSPALIDASANLALSAERIAWGKLLNAGQTCVAPDYVLIPEHLRDTFVQHLDAIIARRYGNRAWLRVGPDYGRMIDSRSVERLSRLTGDSVTQGARTVLGGEFDAGAKFISPTVVVDVTPDMPLMAEELFGPVLPVLTYRTLEEALALINRLDPPLALYAFAEDKAALERIKDSTQSGGMVVNGTVMHLTNPHLPFGGVGASGMGNYHGVHGFRTFTHQRAILSEPKQSATRFVYPPYGRPVLRLVAWMLRQLERQTGPRE